jgi:hypothetical protein
MNDQALSYAEPIPVQDLADCWFYHSMDLPGTGTVHGQWDMRGRFTDYIGGLSVRGRTLLDVGTASGFLLFEAERHGATVTGFDAESWTQYQVIPGRAANHLGSGFNQLRNGFWLAHKAFHSRAKVIYGDIYGLSELVPKHDIVLVGQILVHLRDPLGALYQASLAANEYLVITEGSFESPTPSALFLGRDGNEMTWWHLSDAIYRQWLSLIGFDVVSTSKTRFKCDAPGMPPEIELWTFVSKRNMSAATTLPRKYDNE